MSTKIVVNRKFLNKLADSIHNPAKGTFLRLCNGTLQNGPDPTDAARPMHCGLGELYYAMTGHQPEEDHIDEEGVTSLALEWSTLKDKPSAVRGNALKALKKVGLSKNATDQLEDSLADLDDEDLLGNNAKKFVETLDDIPGKNDDNIKEDVCTIVNYKARSRRVAAQLRKAAKLLPA